MLYLSNQALDFYYRENQIISMKLLTSVIFVISLIGLTSCVEEEGGNGSAQSEKKDSKLVRPYDKFPYDCKQLEEHKNADKRGSGGNEKDEIPPGYFRDPVFGLMPYLTKEEKAKQKEEQEERELKNMKDDLGELKKQLKKD